MISQTQLAAVRGTAHRALAEVFATTIAIGQHVEIPAARWQAIKAGRNEPDGLILPTADIVVRVARDELSQRNITLVPDQTKFVEGGVTYLLSRIRDAKGDPGIVLEGRTA
ncbi:MAG: hypothetical protein ABMA13_20585 [Chthoniobacteraceae bacterium]